MSSSADMTFPGSPSTSIKEINARQYLVAFFHARPHLHAGVWICSDDLIDEVEKFECTASFQKKLTEDDRRDVVVPKK